ncbi:MAG: hypothetical protein QW841_01645 [Candidatus Aenigmatarchaeota archaeon]
MKAQAKIVDMLTVLGLVVCFLILLMQIPKIYKDVFDMLALSSADVVSRDIAGLISISAAAPHKITLIYNTTYKEVSYTVELKDRVATVTYILKGEAQDSVSSPYAIDNLNTKIENQKCFMVTKDQNYRFEFGVCP